MIKKIKAKLCTRAGESIAETLIAMLIAALALVMLAGAIGVAAKMINNSRNAIKTYETQKVGVENSWKAAIQSELQ